MDGLVDFHFVRSLFLASRPSKNYQKLDIKILVYTPIWQNNCSPFQPYLYSVRGLERSELGESHGCPGTDFYERSTRTIVGTMLWTEYRPVIKICPKCVLGSHEIRPIHSAPSLGQSIGTYKSMWKVKRRRMDQHGFPLKARHLHE